MKPGDVACFQNVFWATAGRDARQVELRRLNEHCVLLRAGDELSLVGASVNEARVAIGELQASGKMFCISPGQVILHEATATFAGRPLSGTAMQLNNAGPSPLPSPHRMGRGNVAAPARSLNSGRQDLRENPSLSPRQWGEGRGEGPRRLNSHGTDNVAAIRATLEKAWDKATASAVQTADAWQRAAQLNRRWSAVLPGKPLSLAACKTPGGAAIAVGLESGLVALWNSRGATTGEFKTRGPVQTLAAADLNGDGADELLAGSDDEHIYALDARLSPLWSYKPPFVIDARIPGFCTLGSSKVRKIHVDDLNGDGQPEILAGVGNMYLHCLNRTGRELWRFMTSVGVVAAMTTADVYGDGKR
ncbi:MAG: VCBS repeat-containing protein, partial [Verrucomicrobia bacterium]|nr:VCBS repeat-containing protein [Verrucomicrobiota bacterium]